MPTYDAGTAAIKIKPSFDGFVKKVKAELEAMHFDVDVAMGLDTAAARAELAEFHRVARENVTM
ncbi:hypothetical protein ACWCW7_35135, partial [Nocardia tengchongensis]